MREPLLGRAQEKGGVEREGKEWGKFAVLGHTSYGKYFSDFIHVFLYKKLKLKYSILLLNKIGKNRISKTST